jgi:hypothetical protein
MAEEVAADTQLATSGRPAHQAEGSPMSSEAAARDPRSASDSGPASDPEQLKQESSPSQHEPVELPLNLTEEERAGLEMLIHDNGIEFWAGVYLENPTKSRVPLLAHLVLLGDTRTPEEVSGELLRRKLRFLSRSNVAVLFDRWNQRRSIAESAVERLKHVGSCEQKQALFQDTEPKPVPPRVPKAPSKVVVNWAGNGQESSVTIDDKTFMVSLEGAVVVDILTRRAPAPVTFLQMTKIAPTLQHQDPSKIGRDIINKLPNEIRARIQRKRGSGCTWIS